MSTPSTKRMTTEDISRSPRIQRRWIKCPAPGISQPIAGASMAKVVSGGAVSMTPAVRVVVSAISLFYDLYQHKFRLFPSGDFGVALCGEDVHFAAHAELGEVDTRLDREAGVWQDLTLVFRL